MPPPAFGVDLPAETFSAILGLARDCDAVRAWPSRQRRDERLLAVERRLASAITRLSRAERTVLVVIARMGGGTCACSEFDRVFVEVFEADAASLGHILSRQPGLSRQLQAGADICACELRIARRSWGGDADD